MPPLQHGSGETTEPILKNKIEHLLWQFLRKNAKPTTISSLLWTWDWAFTVRF